MERKVIKKPFYDMDKSEMKMCADNGIIRLVQRLRITFYCKKGQLLYKFEETVQKCENPYTSSAHFSLTVLNQETSDPILEASFNGAYEDTPSYKLSLRPKEAMVL